MHGKAATTCFACRSLTALNAAEDRLFSIPYRCSAIRLISKAEKWFCLELP